MSDDKIIIELEQIRSDIKEIKNMLYIFIGDKAIGRSNSPGITDKIINYLDRIEANTSKSFR